MVMKLPGRTNANVRIRIAWIPVIHVQSIRVPVHVDTVLVGRLLSIALLPLITENLPNVSSLYIFSAVVQMASAPEKSK